MKSLNANILEIIYCSNKAFDYIFEGIEDITKQENNG